MADEQKEGLHVGSSNVAFDLGSSVGFSDKRPLPITQQMQFAATQTMHVGPLPPPDLFESYDRIRPGTADDIVRMAKAGHAAELERAGRALSYSHLTNMTGRYLGACFAGIGLVGGIALVFFGHDAAGTSIATASMAGTIIALITGQKK